MCLESSQIGAHPTFISKGNSTYNEKHTPLFVFSMVLYIFVVFFGFFLLKIILGIVVCQTSTILFTGTVNWNRTTR